MSARSDFGDFMPLLYPFPTQPSVSFVVPGSPRPKDRARRGKGGRWYTPDATRAYEHSVKTCAMVAFAELKEPWPTDRLYRLEVRCFFPDLRHRDADNCLKAVADALNKVGYRDDSQLHTVVAVREFDTANPRTEVKLQAYEQLAPVPKRRKRVA